MRYACSVGVDAGDRAAADEGDKGCQQGGAGGLENAGKVRVWEEVCVQRVGGCPGLGVSFLVGVDVGACLWKRFKCVCVCMCVCV